MFLLLGAVYLHRLPEIQTRWGLSLPVDHLAGHSLVSVMLLALPAGLPLVLEGLYRLGQRIDPSLAARSFVKLAYGYLPLVWAANLAHYLRLGLLEGGRVLPVLGQTLGLDAPWPFWMAHPAVVAFLQGVTLLLGILLSLGLTAKLHRQAGLSRWGQQGCTLIYGISLWGLIVGL
jgi:hypothetical protein